MYLWSTLVFNMNNLAIASRQHYDSGHITFKNNIIPISNSYTLFTVILGAKAMDILSKL